jgi:lipoate---protein ligase
LGEPPAPAWPDRRTGDISVRYDDWEVDRGAGPASAFHARPMPEPVRRSVWVHEVDRAALVLGSTQADGVVDHERARAAGVEVVRRRSGGGAVLLEPGSVLWVDVILPAADPLWDDDVGRAFHWLGEAWASVLGGLGVPALAHTGPLVRTAWSDLVCFAGLGPGEVTVAGAKAVGISQRRTRDGARFQCALLLRPWEPRPLLRLLHLTASERRRATAELAGAATAVERPAAEVETAFLDVVKEC